MRAQRQPGRRPVVKIMSPEAIARCMGDWRSRSRPVLDELFAEAGPATRAHCHQAMAALCDAKVLQAKLDSELGDRSWRALGRLLVVVSENDLLGTSMAMIGACLTGNELLVKARRTQRLVSELKQALDLSDAQCRVVDWSSSEQDDRALLSEVDGVLLAGGESLIAHYRRVTPVGVRLIEYGPKLSCALIGQAQPLGQTVAALLADMSLFAQSVCSSPSFVLVEGEALAEEVYRQALAGLAALDPLDYPERLAQFSRCQELQLRSRMARKGSDEGRMHVDADSGWGVTLSREFDPNRWLPKGLAIISGPLEQLLPMVARRYRHRLQSAGVHGLSDAARSAMSGFTRVCAIGQMHRRAPLEPHDGMLELCNLVELCS